MLSLFPDMQGLLYIKCQTAQNIAVSFLMLGKATRKELLPQS
jgi:hypothetical protein